MVPVLLIAFRCLRAEIEIDRPIVVLPEILPALERASLLVG
jgi:hypothetical protein